MNVDQFCFEEANKYPIQSGKLYFCHIFYIRDENQRRLNIEGVRDGELMNMVFLTLSEAVPYENIFTDLISYRVKVLINNGIVGWISSIYFRNFKLLRDESQE